MTSFLPVRLAASTTRARIGGVGRQRLFDEDMGARLHRGDGEVGMAVGIGVDRDEVRLQRQPRLEARRASDRPAAPPAGRPSERLTRPTISKPGLA